MNQAYEQLDDMNELVKKPGQVDDKEIASKANSKQSEHNGVQDSQESPEIPSAQMNLPQAIHSNLNQIQENGQAISQAIMTRKMLPSKIQLSKV